MNNMEKNNCVTAKRSLSQLSEEEILQIADEIKSGEKSYQQILNEWNVNNKATLFRIKKRYLSDDAAIAPDKTTSLIEIKNEEIKIETINHCPWNSNKIIVAKQIDVLEALLYCIHNLGAIQDELRVKSGMIENYLDQIADSVSLNMKTYSKGQEKEKNKLVRDIYRILTKVSQIASLYLVRIKALNELGRQIETYKKSEVDVEAKKEVISLIRTIFRATQKFSKEQYEEFKSNVISEFEGAKWLFEEYEFPQISTRSEIGEVEGTESTDLEDKRLPE